MAGVDSKRYDMSNLCPVGDVSGEPSAGQFTTTTCSADHDDCPTRFRTESDKFLYSLGSQVVSPHILQQSSCCTEGQDSSVTPAACASSVDYAFEELCVNMHKLNTTADIWKETLLPSCEATNVYISPSPSPLSEPIFEPYVYCTKTRSETSYSNESQFSSSSNERGATASPSHVVDVGEQETPSSRPSSSSGSSHRPLSRQNQSSVGVACHRFVPSSSSSVGQQLLERSGEDEGREVGQDTKEGGAVTLLVSPNHDSPEVCRTKPILPPSPRGGDEWPWEGESPVSPLYFPSIHSVDPIPPSAKSQSSLPKGTFLASSSPPSSSSSPPAAAAVSSLPNTELHASLGTQRQRAVTFLRCKVGEEGGKFSADYLGMKEVDMYIKSINSVAKELAVNQRPMEIHAYVTSERVRLAPPNSATLFQSFAVKDILLVRKCTKNKRIIGVMVWKQMGTRPACHILRCPDNVTAASLYDSLWQQTQKVDDVPFNQV